MNETITINVSDTMKLPSGLEVVLTALDGNDQRILLDQSKLRSGRGINEVLARHVSIEGKLITPEYADKMLEGDRVKLLIRLRRLSFGDIIKNNMKCTNKACSKFKNAFPFIIELSDEDEEISPYPLADTKRTIIDVQYAVRYTKIDKTEEFKRKIEISLRTGIETQRLLNLGDNFTVHDLLQVRNPVEILQDEKRGLRIECEPILFQAALSEEVAKLEPDFSNKILDISCPECQTIQRMDIARSPHFLLPQMI